MINQSLKDDYFPLSVAADQAFCNRKEEITLLKNHLEQHRAVLLVAPRRYGKTSLVLHTISLIKRPYAFIDFFSAVDEADVEKIILQGIGELILQMESAPKRALALASQFFEGTQVLVALNKVGLSIEVHRQKEKPAYRILDTLERLEKLCEKMQKKVILFFDEFQCLGEITKDHAIESVLRQVAQLTKSISFVFSGSNRHLLSQMFDDRHRPLYKLCERITLDRISEAAYEKHIQQIAKETWGAELSQQALSNIFHYSECHSYYINLLCSRLINGTFPSPEMIDHLWKRYVTEEQSNVASEIELLSKHQKKLLTILARTNGTKLPTGQDFIQKAGISKATLKQALTFLERKDYVYTDKTGTVKVLDPLIKSVLSGFIS